jgi:hypothetical protein
MRDNLSDLFREQVLNRLRDERLFGGVWFRQRRKRGLAAIVVLLGVTAFWLTWKAHIYRQ